MTTAPRRHRLHHAPTPAHSGGDALEAHLRLLGCGPCDVLMPRAVPGAGALLARRAASHLQVRTIEDVATDRVRDYCFTLFVADGAAQPPVLASLDMRRPFRLQRDGGYLLCLVAPRGLVESLFPEAASLHGRTLVADSPARLSLCARLADLARAHDDQELLACIGALVEAFGRDAGMSGSPGALLRAAMFGRVRQHISDNLTEADLSPSGIVRDLGLPRASVYRMFQDEGGMAAYIRDCRLREAADQLVSAPTPTLLELCYSLGFNSASEFSRAFRRAFDITPSELRKRALAR